MCDGHRRSRRSIGGVGHATHKIDRIWAVVKSLIACVANVFGHFRNPSAEKLSRPGVTWKSIFTSHTMNMLLNKNMEFTYDPSQKGTFRWSATPTEEKKYTIRLPSQQTIEIPDFHATWLAYVEQRYPEQVKKLKKAKIKFYRNLIPYILHTDKNRSNLEQHHTCNILTGEWRTDMMAFAKMDFMYIRCADDIYAKEILYWLDQICK